jgi:hypothetical protein
VLAQIMERETKLVHPPVRPVPPPPPTASSGQAADDGESNSNSNSGSATPSEKPPPLLRVSRVFGVPKPDEVGSFSVDVALRLDLSTLEQIEELEEKVANASMQIKVSLARLKARK